VTSMLAILPRGEAERLHQGQELLPELESFLVVSTLREGLEALGRHPWSVVLLSLSVPGVERPLALRVAGSRGVGRLILSRVGPDLEFTLAAQEAGVAAVLPEPLDWRKVAAEVGDGGAGGDWVPLPEPPAGEGEAFPIVGSSRAMAELFQTLARVADTPATVLIQGESGTGKELVARALHRAGTRAAHPFVAVNCAAIPEHLLEAELFGHEKGAFTGAVARTEGRFGRAHQGTLFLDEIGDMSLVLQAKILRALEGGEVERVGGGEPRRVDVRVVAATNRPLAAMVEAGEFREDLYYRLAVVEMHLPPLRERPEDVEALTLHFAGSLARRYGRPLEGVATAALNTLRSHSWPGNVRELRNVVDRGVLLARGPVLGPGELQIPSGERVSGGSPGGPTETEARRSGGEGYPPGLSLKEVEALHIARVLRHTGGHMGEAAAILGIHRNTMTAKFREYGLGEDP